jgi:hypothetical protein
VAVVTSGTVVAVAVGLGDAEGSGVVVEVAVAVAVEGMLAGVHTVAAPACAIGHGSDAFRTSSSSSGTSIATGPTKTRTTTWLPTV